jgi:hypothetical protein
LGDRLAEFERELADALRPFAADGLVSEEIHASARVFR